MKDESMTAKVGKSLFWKFFERGGVQVTQFVVSLVIARILEPKAYGPVAILTVFVTLATVFVQSGLGTALVQKKDADETDYSSVFYYSFAVAVILYGVLFLSAGGIAAFYKMPELKSLLRVMALTLFPGAFNSVQISILSRQMRFRLQFISSLVSVALSGGIGIALAKLGYGAWALVGQQLSYQVFICLVLLVLQRWVPKLTFSFERTKGLLAYGIKLLGARLIDTLYHNLESLIIGKKYSADVLAYCNKGKQFPLTMIDNIDGAVQSVMLPAYSARQDDIQNVKSMLRRMIAMSTYLVFPAMMGLAVVGKPLITIVLGEKWLGCVPFLQLYCIIAMLFPMQTANLQAINALGHSGTYLKLMTIKRTVGVAVLFGSVFCFNSVYAIVWACLAIEVFGILVNIPANQKILGYRFGELMADILPNLIISAVMAFGVLLIAKLRLNIWILLVVQCVAGVGLYIGLSVLTRNQSFNNVIPVIKKTLHK